MSDSTADAQLREEAEVLSKAAATRGLVLRVTGSLAVQLHCHTVPHLFGLLGRRPLQDLDFVGYSRDQAKLIAVFEEYGYALDPAVRHSQEYGIQRLIFHKQSAASEAKVDVFLDRLLMAHVVDFRGRLELVGPTLPLADLVLTKLQIHEITSNDLIDLVVLFADHDIGLGHAEMIDSAYISTVLANDWGFWYTASVNIDRIDSYAGERGLLLTPTESERVGARLMRLREAIEAEPKSLKWRLRSQVGPRLRWYDEVSEV